MLRYKRVYRMHHRKEREGREGRGASSNTAAEIKAERLLLTL